MADSLAEAQAAVRQAQLAKEALLARAIDGENISHEELLGADLECDKAERLLKLEGAKAVGAKQRAEMAAIEVLRAKVEELVAAHSAAIDARIEADEACDEAFAHLQDLVEASFAAGQLVNKTAMAMTGHNTLVDLHLPPTNATLAAMQSADRPRCPRVDAYWPLKIRAKLS